jgi:hypothetical protein
MLYSFNPLEISEILSLKHRNCSLVGQADTSLSTTDERSFLVLGECEFKPLTARRITLKLSKPHGASPVPWHELSSQVT